METVEQQYWAKLAELKAVYEEPMKEIISNVNKVLKKPLPQGRNDLEIIHKKLVCMFSLLQNTPEIQKQRERQDNIRMDILQNAEKQMEQWVSQNRMIGGKSRQKKVKSKFIVYSFDKKGAKKRPL